MIARDARRYRRWAWLHDAAEHDDVELASVRALPRLVALLDERGLTSVGLDALLGN